MEQINNRLCLLSERLIVRQGYLHDYRAGLFIMVFMYKLENLADSVRMLCDILLRNSPLLASKLVRQSYGQVRDLYETLVEFVHDGNRAKLDLMQDARLGFAPKLLTDTGSGSVAQARVLAAMHRIVLEIYDLAGIRLATTI